MDIKKKSPSGFTLMELLVVIGIVAVIAAILFPVFESVRERTAAGTVHSLTLP